MTAKKNKLALLNVGVFITILLCGFTLYYSSLQGASFYLDDHFSIETNQAIKHIDITKIFNAFNTRSLVGLSFALNYQWCSLHAVGYRAVNLLIHCLNAFLVYLLAKFILNWPIIRTLVVTCHPEPFATLEGRLREES